MNDFSVMTFREFVSLLADMMTLLGIGGLFSWAFVKQGVKVRGDEGLVAKVMAGLLKLVLSLAWTAVVAVFLLYALTFLVAMLNGHYSLDDGWWNPEKRWAFLGGYAIILALALPSLVLPISSLWLWSWAPFKRVGLAFTRRQAT